MTAPRVYALGEAPPETPEEVTALMLPAALDRKLNPAPRPSGKARSLLAPSKRRRLSKKTRDILHRRRVKAERERAIEDAMAVVLGMLRESERTAASISTLCGLDTPTVSAALRKLRKLHKVRIVSGRKWGLA